MDFRKDPPIDYENNLNIQDSIYGPAYKNSTHLFPIRLWISLLFIYIYICFTYYITNLNRQFDS